MKLRICALTVIGAISASVPSAAADRDRVPVLLELFTSEGCSSCPPADRLLQQFDEKQPVAGAELVVLSEHVDYWDRQGWKDPFSSPLYTSRQEVYSDRFSPDGAFTPQLIIDGRFGCVGSDARGAVADIEKAIHEPKIPLAIADVTRDGSRVSARIDVSPVDAAKKRRAVLYVAIADNRAESHPGRGENAGHVLTHVAVVRVLKQIGTIDLGSATTKQLSLAAPAGMGASGLRVVAFLQDPKSGHILGVEEHKL